jgi:hypothetical protein
MINPNIIRLSNYYMMRKHSFAPRRVRRTSIVLCYSDRKIQSEMHKATILIANVTEATNLFVMC